MKAIKIFSDVLWLVIILLIILSTGLCQAQGATVVQQFTVGKHVLGFQPDGLNVVGGDHLLKVTFVEANRVTPIADQPPSLDNQTQPMGKVTYPSLWDGISLMYEQVSGGIAKSTYWLEPGADAGKIRLRYNVPVQMNAQGELIFDFQTGQVSESVPIAWQEINGQRSFVSVSYRKLAEREVGFVLGTCNPAYPLIIDPILQWQWNTFLGSSVGDYGYGIAVDDSGNVYLTGSSLLPWGEPINSPGGGTDAFVAKLDNSGALKWNTFLGCPLNDIGYGIAVDSYGNVYVTGVSQAIWVYGGSTINPVRSYSGHNDAFAVKLNRNGGIEWYTLLGGLFADQGNNIAVDDHGNVYVGGESGAAWDWPVNPHAGNYDAFVAKLNVRGTLLWHTFLGSSTSDKCFSIAIDDSGNVYVAGESLDAWGSPIRPFAKGYDAFAGKLDNNGVLKWHTFLGSTSPYDYGYGIAVDGDGNVYVGGWSGATWGTPINPFAGYLYLDAFVTRLNNNGVLQWNTFLGSSNHDERGHCIAIDSSSNVYVAGWSGGTWGAPVNPHAGRWDAFVAKLSNNGVFQGNTFLGASYYDYGYSIAADNSGNAYVAGYSDTSWGSPVNGFAGNIDAFAVKLGPEDVVPVELVSFSAKSNGHSVTLNWATATEINNYGFEVQRKNQSDSDWKQIGSVMGNGTTATPHSYSFVDDNISVGVYCYRLKQIDFDGSFEFTDQISIEIKPPGTFSMDQNYPNPFNPETVIRFSVKEAGKVSLKIYNLQGQVIRTLVDEKKSGGSYSVMWNGKDDNGVPMVSGVYYYTLKANRFTETRKLTLIK